jgi:hypothetical protein
VRTVSAARTPPGILWEGTLQPRLFRQMSVEQGEVGHSPSQLEEPLFAYTVLQHHGSWHRLDGSMGEVSGREAGVNPTRPRSFLVGTGVGIPVVGTRCEDKQVRRAAGRSCQLG